MNIEGEVFFAALLILLWLLSAWDALTQLSRGRVRKIISTLKRKNSSEKVEDWLDNRESYRIVFRILSFATLTILSIVAFLFIDKYYGNQYTTLAKVFGTGLLVFILIVIIESGSKVIAIFFDIQLLRITLPVIKALRYSILYPVVKIYRNVQNRFEEWHKHENEEERATTEDEIMSWVEQDDNEGEGPSPLEEDEKRMIRGIFDLDDTPVREIMTPRVDLTALSADTSIDEAKKVFIESGHSRIPLYTNNVDEIKSIILAKDFLDETKLKKSTLESLAHTPIFIPETKAVGELLDEIKKNRNHCAVVIDEYGGTAGIVTLEDIIEEIVGEIRDEYDTEDDGEQEPVKTSDGSYIVDARMLICDVNELVDSNLPEDEDVDTIGGYVCGELGKIPEEGESIVIGNLRVIVIKADKRKILSLKLEIQETEDLS